MMRCKKIARAIGALLLAGLVLSSCKDQQPSAAGDLIGAFQGSCVTTGRWTQAALAHNQALVQVMQNLKTHDACKPYVSTLSTIQGLSGQISALLQNDSYSNYRIAEEKLQELTLALAGAAPGSDAARSLSQAVIQTQIDLAEARAANLVSDSLAERNRYVASTQQLAVLMQGILGSAGSGLASCLQQSPAASLELATNLLAIGGSFVSPIVGAGAAVIGQLVTTAVEYVRTAGPEAAIYELYSAQMPTALGCALESMSELYCGADDAFSLLNVQAQAYPAPGGPSLPIWEGMDLLGRRLPVLFQWLQGVKNGVLPSDALEAQRQNDIWKKLHRLDDFYRTVYATLRDGERIYNAATDGGQRYDIIVNTIEAVAYTLAPPQGTSTDTSNPFRDKSRDAIDFACWLVWGPATVDCKKTDPRHPFGYDNVKQYVKEVLLVATPNADYTLLGRNWMDLFTLVDKLVTLQFSQTITADPQSLLAEARQGPTPKETPRVVLDMILSFLKHMLDQDDHTNPQLPSLIMDTMAMITDVTKILDDTSCTDGQGQPIDCEIKRLRQISDIFERFELRRSLQFFVDRINNFVEWDLEYKVRHGQIPTDISDILISAGTDIRSRLSAAGVLNDLTPLVQDLNKARSIVQGNLKTFRSYFEESMGKSVLALQQAAIDAGEPAEGANRPNGQVLGQLCTLILATGQEWPTKVSWDVCSKAVLSSIYPDPKGQLSLHLDKLKKELDGKPFGARICAFHRFLRAGKLAEVLQTGKTSDSDLYTYLATGALGTR